MKKGEGRMAKSEKKISHFRNPQFAIRNSYV